MFRRRHPPPDQAAIAAAAIAEEAAALARRAHGAGLSALAYLLDMAVMEARRCSGRDVS